MIQKFGTLQAQSDNFFKTNVNGLSFWGIARVNYINSFEHNLIEDGKVLPNTYHPFMLKYKSYDFEKEVRLLAVAQQSHEVEPDGLNIEIDIDTLIDSIVINPYSSAENKQKVYSLLKKHKVDSKLKESLLASSSFYMRD